MADVGANSSKSCAFVIPWVISLLLGILTALTGSFIAINGDFLCDLRVGFCRGLLLADRTRCCGGSDNVDFQTDRCMRSPFVAHDLHVDSDVITVEWIPWDDYFGVDMHFCSLLLYFLPSLLWSAIAAFLVLQYSDGARGSGIPEVQATVSGYDLPHSFSFSCLLVKALGLSFVVGAGLSLGKEGALIHIGVCWAYLFHSATLRFSDILGSSIPLHEIVCAGGAAGVSTAFGAPLGGVLYALEGLGSVRELNSRTLLISFFAAFSASFMLKFLNLSGANHLTFFSLTLPTMNPKKEWLAWEMVFFLLTGIAGGVVGALFVALNVSITKARSHGQLRKLLWMFPTDLQMFFFKRCGYCRIDHDGEHADISDCSLGIIEVVVIALVTAVLNLCFTTLLRTGQIEAIHALFETCPSRRAIHFGLCDSHAPHRPNLSSSVGMSLLLAAATRMLQASYTFGAALPSGIFIPSLFIGAAIGRSMGHLLTYLTDVHNLTTHIEPGVFAMVGAAAMLSGFSRLTFTIVVIMLELTGELTYVVPFMCAVLTAKLVGDTLTSSVFDAHAKLNGYSTACEMDVRVGLCVGDVAVAVMPNDGFFESSPISLQVLARRLSTRAAETEGSSSEALLVLHGDGQENDTATVAGIIDRTHAQRWISQHDCSKDRLCSLREPSVQTDGVFGMGAYADVRMLVAGDGSELDTIEAEALHKIPSLRPLDVSGLVDKDIRHISSMAPLLTAMSTFEQHPQVRYCVCVDGRCPGTFRLLSRQALDDALASSRFPLVHTLDPNVTDMIPSQRTVGADAVLATCARAWRHFVCNRFNADHVGSPLISDRLPLSPEADVHELVSLDALG